MIRFEMETEYIYKISNIKYYFLRKIPAIHLFKKIIKVDFIISDS